MSRPAARVGVTMPLSPDGPEPAVVRLRHLCATAEGGLHRIRNSPLAVSLRRLRLRRTCKQAPAVPSRAR
ncbi:hypothetical protein HYPSUDRAFT_37084, partial [Hypholoma sublateritium FD-334 SS-4]